MNTDPSLYTQRLAMPNDTSVIAPLWEAFALERSQADPSMVLKPEFNFERYIAYQLQRPFSYAFLLEFTPNSETQKEVVGIIFIYFYDETPPGENRMEDLLENPFQNRRIGAVLGLYISPPHREQKNIKLLIDAAIAKAEELKVSDIDLLISADQPGIQSLLQRNYQFKKSAVQYTRHYDISSNQNLPSLHSSSPEIEGKPTQFPSPSTIPLRNPKTHEVVKNPQGEIIFLEPIVDESGNCLKTSNGLPIYSDPLREPETRDWVFDLTGKLVVRPILKDGDGKVVEYLGMPQFCKPCYEKVGTQIQLKRNKSGEYLFLDAERDTDGMIIRSSDGKPTFQ